MNEEFEKDKTPNIAPMIPLSKLLQNSNIKKYNKPKKVNYYKRAFLSGITLGLIIAIVIFWLIFRTI